mmetsp:Transcript_5077/g.8257  ORF Transcript_5077/g.8257 Transcript_5077/m.8257 type:complete len:236 (-) Transcript_5077:1587-2294(-)
MTTILKIVAIATIQHIVTGTTKLVTARFVSKQHIIASRSHVLARERTRLLILAVECSIAAFTKRAKRAKVAFVVGAALSQAIVVTGLIVVRIAAVQDIVASATLLKVDVIIAVQHVVALSTKLFVFATTAVQHIVARTTVLIIVAVATIQHVVAALIGELAFRERVKRLLAAVDRLCLQVQCTASVVLTVMIVAERMDAVQQFLFERAQRVIVCGRLEFRFELCDALQKERFANW